jgi:uncharacterized membrane protein
MAYVPTPAAGGRPPAVAVPGDWVEWRDRQDVPLYSATLWPNRSLAPAGRRFVLRATAIGLALPLLAVAGTPVVWGLLPFAAAALGMLWYGFRRNQFDGRLTEAVAIWPDEMRVERCEPRGRVRRWAADPYRVRVALHAEAKVEQYLTLRGGGREIELGAFLSPEERVALAGELEAALTRAVRAG